jgi:cytochrome c553
MLRLIGLPVFLLFMWRIPTGLLAGQREQSREKGKQESAAGEPSASEWELLLPDSEGKSYVTGLCETCHSVKIIVLQRLDEPAWRGVLGRMNASGANLEEDDIAALAKYLTENFGLKQAALEIPMDLNKAPAEQIARLPQITKDEAAQIVSARTKEPFKQASDLKKILASEKIERILPFISLR